MATVYVRYKQVEALTADAGAALGRLNLAGLALGLLSSLGMCVVANFQVRAAGPGPGRRRRGLTLDPAHAENRALPGAPAGGGADPRGGGPLHPGADAAVAPHAAPHPQQAGVPGPPGHRAVDPGQHHQQYPPSVVCLFGHHVQHSGGRGRDPQAALDPRREGGCVCVPPRDGPDLTHTHTHARRDWRAVCFRATRLTWSAPCPSGPWPWPSSASSSPTSGTSRYPDSLAPPTK
ncbi:unnamed protein product [Tetraodon nigroviridis]|uniref:Chromosome undetermined SCAF8829, whole genome shotgun sequence n=1 Tax=Tetraodon nigroviridis TaxID=99883 RepID=Q4T6B7_TETNG|nr:unnamed protein product [Tetraodon nigroviridis]